MYKDAGVNARATCYAFYLSYYFACNFSCYLPAVLAKTLHFTEGPYRETVHFCPPQSGYYLDECFLTSLP